MQLVDYLENTLLIILISNGFHNQDSINLKLHTWDFGHLSEISK